MPAPSQATGPNLLATAAPSFAQAYREYAVLVARWAAHLGGPESDVEDAVQEVFLVVSRKWSSLRCDGNFINWLFQITRKIVANQRRRLRWRRLWSGNDDLACVLWEGPDAETELDRRRVIIQFHRALDRLPEKQRTVFVLYELEGLSTPEIAELMQRNVSTVKVQLARAREHFIAAYRRLLRRGCDVEEITLSKLALRAIKTEVRSTPQFGKKTS